ncbi:MAG: (2Fe-2S)-binding protein [Acidobacteriota bacterium]|nr:(2Fe-2S)-binding protein [Acidobacteriota bacterium]
MISSAARREKNRNGNANGRAAAFTCGVSVEFRLAIDEATKCVDQAGFTTNGCGYAIAVAEKLADGITGTELVRLEGLSVLEDLISTGIGEAPGGRHHCFNICFDALQNSLADFRRRQIAGWNGEDALICSCFGVAESFIETAVREHGLCTIEAVGASCRAGTGCGSCQPLIQEILDSFD